MSISPGRIDLDLKESGESLEVLIYTRSKAAGPLHLEVHVLTGRSPDFVSQWVSPSCPLDPMDGDETRSLTLDLPPLPTEDFFVTAALTNHGTTWLSTARAFRSHEGALISAGTLDGLNDAELRADLDAGRIDQATHRRRSREIHRRHNTES